MTDLRFPDRVAAVPGGGGNIGGAICRRLALEGARVAVVDIDAGRAEAVAGEIKAMGGQAVAIPADLRTRAAVEQAFDEAEAVLGPVTVLVNSVGVDHSLDPTAIDDEEWDLIMDSNLRSPFLTCQRVVRSWLGSTTAGTIVNIASVESVMPFPQQLHYASSKGGVQMLTRALAHDVARAGYPGERGRPRHRSQAR